MSNHSSILAGRIPMDRGFWQAAVHRITKSWAGPRYSRASYLGTGPSPALRPAHRVPGVPQVEQQAAVLGLVAAVGGLCQVEEGCLDASSNALHTRLGEVS